MELIYESDTGICSHADVHLLFFLVMLFKQTAVIMCNKCNMVCRKAKKIQHDFPFSDLLFITRRSKVTKFCNQTVCITVTI